MRYTRNDIRAALKLHELEGGEILSDQRAIAIACMRECLKNMQETFESGDILKRGENEYNGNYGIFTGYSNDEASHCHVITITRTGEIGGSCWTVAEVEKIGHLDISNLESVLEYGFF